MRADLRRIDQRMDRFVLLQLSNYVEIRHAEIAEHRWKDNYNT